MLIRNIVRPLSAAIIALWAMASPTVMMSPSAAADPCPDVDAVVARGTGEPPGAGGVGQHFVDALRAQAGPRSVGEYPVNYAASNDFGDRDAFVRTVIDGIRNAADHIQSEAARCPATRIVLAGYSQGAALVGYTTVDHVPPGVPAGEVPAPLPPQVANHVAAVVLFGKPSQTFLNNIGAPPIVIGPLFAPKVIDLCNPGDTICDGADAGGPSIAHALYGTNGSVDQAAAFTVSRL
ncbi:MAG: alpha/beta fold hydrolase [Mycobacterium sp.]